MKPASSIQSHEQRTVREQKIEVKLKPDQSHVFLSIRDEREINKLNEI